MSEKLQHITVEELQIEARYFRNTQPDCDTAETNALAVVMVRTSNRLIDAINDLKEEVDTLKRAEADRCRMEGNEI